MSLHHLSIHHHTYDPLQLRTYPLTTSLIVDYYLYKVGFEELALYSKLKATLLQSLVVLL